MNLEDITKWNSFVVQRFEYTADPWDKDSWSSSAQQLFDDPNFVIHDDCDGLASTVAEVLDMKGDNKVWRLLVSSTHNGQVDHMISMTEDDKGDRYIVGDTFNDYPVPFADCPHEILMYNNIENGIQWTTSP